MFANKITITLLFLCTFITAFGLQRGVVGAQPTTAPSALPLDSDGLILESDNLHAPYMAVYRWDVSGLKHGLQDTYAAWLNRGDVWPESHEGKETWENTEGPSWQLQPWQNWMTQHPRARFILSVSILVGKWDLSGPERGPDAHVPVSLAEGAKGTYNPHFTKLAQHLVKAGMGNAILRLGWEFNGGWMPWRVTSKDTAEAYAGYWRQIVTTMRAVPGAGKLEFCWNPNLGRQSFSPDAAWPGDDYVDNIGIDIYDDGYGQNTYPWPADTSPEEIEARRKKVWDGFYSEEYGLLWFKKFAAQHHKTLSIPEWGVNKKPDKHGGLDNTYFIKQMYKFIHDPSANVEWQCYFDVTAGDGGHQLSPDAKNPQTVFPKSAELFRKLFTPSESMKAQGMAPVIRARPEILESAVPTTRGAALVTKCTDAGFSIDTGDGKPWIMTYPSLLDPTDQGLAHEQISVKSDGSGATMSYTPSGKMSIGLQSDGNWLIHISEIPEPEVKFTFGITISPSRIDQGTSWSADGAAEQLVPKAKDQLHLYQGSPQKVSFLNQSGGFSLLFPKKTWTVLDDQRVWGKRAVRMGCIYYFPNKKHVPEISWGFSVGKPDASLSSAQP